MNPFESGLTRYLKPEQLAMIQKERVCIAGAGGLGSNVAMALIRTGFKRFEILDRDVVDPSNLNRQDFTIADIGRAKVDALQARMLSVNPDAHIITYQAEWTRANADAFFVGPRLMVEAFDKAEVKTEFVEWAAQHAQYVVSGNGMASLIGAGTPPPPRSARQGAAAAGLHANDATTVRRIGNIFMVGDRETSITDGHPPLAPRVMQCAAKMAEIVLDLTLGLE